MHSKGSWQLDDYYVMCPYDGKANYICRMLGRGDETEANAHLIAAAPDLLEACLEARDALEDPDPDIYATALRVVNKAIAKARVE